MLVLTRRVGDALYIGEGVKLVVLGVRGTQVRIGVEAPETVRVLRAELLQRKENEGEGVGKTDNKPNESNGAA